MKEQYDPGENYLSKAVNKRQKIKHMIANEKEFDESLKKLGDLYEEGKDCLNYFIMYLSGEEQEKAYRLYDILKEIRDLSAVNMQKLHFKIEN